MSQLVLNLTNGNQFVIELVDSPFIHNWAEAVAEKDMWETEHVALGSDSYDPDRFAETLDTLYKSLLTVPEVMGCAVPECFPGTQSYSIDDVEYTQHWMNIIHRWCVYSMMHQPYIVEDVDITPGAIAALKSDKLDATIKLLFELNQQVHAVESTYKSPGADSFPCTGVYNAPYWDQGFEGDQVGYAPKVNYTDLLDEILTKENYDVYIAKRILGKDFRETWLDADDPSAVDVVNVGDLLHYAFEVDPLNDLSSFYKGSEFESWMAEYNRDTSASTVGRIPVGNIINLGTPEETRKILTTERIKSIEFVE